MPGPYKIKLQEPKTNDYISVDKDGNLHVIYKVFGGQLINTDNTCQSAVEQKRFMGYQRKDSGGGYHPSAQKHLEDYAQALENDIKMLGPDHELTEVKKKRIVGVREYISAMRNMQLNPSFKALEGAFPENPPAVQKLMGDKTNLLSMLLRPTVPDSYTRANGYVFTVDRRVDRRGNAASALYNNLHDTFKITKPKNPTSPWMLIKKDMEDKINQQPDMTFDDIQKAMNSIASKHNLGVTFDQDRGGQAVNNDYIEMIYMTDESTTVMEYAEILVNACHPELTESTDDPKLIASPYAKTVSDFYAAEALPDSENTAGTKAHLYSEVREKMSILTQMFLAEINIYCYSNDISKEDFGKIIDAKNIHQANAINVAGAVKEALEKGQLVEEAILNCINENKRHFKLARELTNDDFDKINEAFKSHWQTVQYSPHFDEFSILTDKEGPFCSFKGSIGFHFGHIVAQNEPALKATMQDLVAKFEAQKLTEVPNINDFVDSFEISETQAHGYLDSCLNSPEQMANLLTARDNNGHYFFEDEVAINKLNSIANGNSRFNTILQNTLNLACQKLEDEAAMYKLCKLYKHHYGLFEAAKKGEQTMVKSLIDAGVNANNSDEKGMTAAHYAAQNDHIETVKYLLETVKVPLTQINSQGNNLLHLAARMGCEETLDYLLELNDNQANNLLELKNSQLQTPLICAALGNKQKAMIALLKAGADADKYFYDGWDGYTLFSYVLHNNMQDVAEYLLNDPKHKATFEDHITNNLFNLIKNNQIDMLDYIFKKYPGMVNYIDDDPYGYQKTLVDVAIEYNQVDALKLILAQQNLSFYLDNPRFESKICDLAKNNNYEILDALLDKFPSLCNIKVQDKTLLQHALDNKHPKTVETLLKHGADFDELTMERLACEQDSPIILKHLLNKLFNRTTPTAPLSDRDLFYLNQVARSVIENNSEKCLNLLFNEYNLDPDAAPAEEPLLLIAARNGSADIFKNLIRRGAKNHTAENTSTLIEAVQANALEIAEIALTKGVDTSIKNKDGKTAVDIAYDNFNTDPQMLDLLCKHKVDISPYVKELYLLVVLEKDLFHIVDAITQSEDFDPFLKHPQIGIYILAESLKKLPFDTFKHIYEKFHEKMHEDLLDNLRYTTLNYNRLDIFDYLVDKNVFTQQHIKESIERTTQPDMIMALLDKGLNIDDKLEAGISFFQYIISLYKPDVKEFDFQAIIDKYHPDLEIQDYAGNTALTYLINNPEQLKILLHAGANPNVLYNDPLTGKTTPLLTWAVQNDKREIIDALFESDKINVNFCTDESNLPLANCKNPEMVQKLVDKGAKINDLTETHVKNALNENRLNPVAKWVELGLNPDIKIDGTPLLHWALKQEPNMDIHKLHEALFSTNVNSLELDADGKNAIEAAIDGRYFSFRVKTILEQDGFSLLLNGVLNQNLFKTLTDKVLPATGGEQMGGDNAWKSPVKARALQLIQEAITPNIQVQGMPAIYWAIKNGHADIVTKLLNEGASIDIESETWKLVADTAFLNIKLPDYMKTIEALCEKQIDIGPWVNNQLPTISNYGSLSYLPSTESLLKFALDNDLKNTVEAICSSNHFNLLHTTEFLGTYLYSIHDCLPKLPMNMFDILIRKNIDKIDTEFMSTIARAAAHNERLDMVDFLIDRKLLNNDQLSQCLFQAPINCIKPLIERGANINCINSQNGNSVLMEAIMMFTPNDPLDELLKFNPNLDLVNSEGDTALSYAAKFNRVDIITKLLNAGANPNVTIKPSEDAEPIPLLTWAVQHGKKDLIQLLLKSDKMDLSLEIYKQNYPLSSAKSIDIADLLINEADIDVNELPPTLIKDIIFDYDYKKLVEWIKKGLDPNIKVDNQPLFNYVTQQHSRSYALSSFLDQIINHPNFNPLEHDEKGITALQATRHLSIRFDYTIMSKLLSHQNFSLKTNGKINYNDLNIILNDILPNTVCITNEFRNECIELLKNIIQADTLIQDIPALHWAVNNNHKELLNHFITQPNVDINALSPNGQTALSIAIKNRNTDITQLLLKNGASLTTKLADNKTVVDLLFEQIQTPDNKKIDQDIAMLDLLCEAGADISQYLNVNVSNFDMTLFEMAINKYAKHLLDSLLNNPNLVLTRNGSNRHSIITSHMHYLTNEQFIKLLNIHSNVLDNSIYEELLTTAIHSGSFDKAKILFEKHNFQQDILDSNLQFANPDFLKELVKQGANINRVDNNGETPLVYHAKYDNISSVQTLIELGADPNKTIGFDYISTNLPLLTWAVKTQNILLVSELLKSEKIDINIKDSLGKTPLYYALVKNGPNIIQSLLKAGADSNVTVKPSENAEPIPLLTWAAQNDRRDIVNTLLENGTPDFNLGKDTGNLPLAHASTPEMAKLLIDNGADILHIKESDVANAINENRLHVVAAWVKAGLNPDIKIDGDPLFHTLLAMPYSLGRNTLLFPLLDHVDPLALDTQNQNAIEIALKNLNHAGAFIEIILTLDKFKLIENGEINTSVMSLLTDKVLPATNGNRTFAENVWKEGTRSKCIELITNVISPNVEIQGMPALDWAQNQGYTEIVESLQEQIAAQQKTTEQGKRRSATFSEESSVKGGDNKRQRTHSDAARTPQTKRRN